MPCWLQMYRMIFFPGEVLQFQAETRSFLYSIVISDIFILAVYPSMPLAIGIPRTTAPFCSAEGSGPRIVLQEHRAQRSRPASTFLLMRISFPRQPARKR